MNIQDYFGATTNFLYRKNDDDFFKGYKSTEDFFIRSAINIGGLFLQIIVIVVCIILALVCYIGSCLYHLGIIDSNKGIKKKDSKDHHSLFKSGNIFAIATPMFIVSLILSPVGNLISLIGSLVITAIPSLTKEDEAPQESPILS